MKQALLVEEVQSSRSLESDCPDVGLNLQMACTFALVQRSSGSCECRVVDPPLDRVERREERGGLFLG